MDKNLCAKTLLSSLPHIDKYCESVTRANTARAIASMNDVLQSTQDIMERIIDRTYKVQQLHNLKVKMIEQLKAMKPATAMVLDLHFIKHWTPAKIADRVGLTERSVFRQIQIGVDKFGAGLERVGVDEPAFNTMLTSYPWIRSFYLQLSNPQSL